MIDATPTCTHERTKKAGITKAGTQRHKCLNCGKRFTTSTRQLAGMRVDMDKVAQVLSMLCEDMSIRAAARLSNISLPTILDLLTLVGFRCQQFLEAAVKGVEVNDVQVDEVWQFVYCKRRTAERVESTGYGGKCGDSWCFTAVERHTKMVLAWHFGRRYLNDTMEFCRKLRQATVGHFHLSTDGYQPYLQAVPRYFAGQIDYGMLVKSFSRSQPEGSHGYSPARIIGAKKEVVMGSPDDKRICTSHTERNNGSMRLFVKRMNRLTYAFSKKWVNHEAALGLYFAHFNFCRQHRTLQGRTPAMASGLTDHVWTVAELLAQIA